MAIEDMAIRMPTGSGLTNGHGMALTGSLVTAHQPPSGETHDVAIYLNNPTAAALDVTIRTTESATNRDRIVSVAAKSSGHYGTMRLKNAVTLALSGSGCFADFIIQRVD